MVIMTELSELHIAQTVLLDEILDDEEYEWSSEKYDYIQLVPVTIKYLEGYQDFCGRILGHLVLYEKSFVISVRATIPYK
jgi:hypothetical protein